MTCSELLAVIKREREREKNKSGFKCVCSIWIPTQLGRCMSVTRKGAEFGLGPVPPWVDEEWDYEDYK